MQILLPVIGFLPFLSLIIAPGSDLMFVHNVQGFSYNLFRESLSESPNILILASFLLVVFSSIILFFINIRYDILGQRSVMLSYFYLFLVCIPMTNLYMHPAGLAASVLFVGLLFVFSIYHKARAFSGILNAGILFGISALIYPPFILLFPVFWIAIARMKQPSWRDFVVVLMGFLIPVWLYGSYLFLSNHLAYEWIAFTQWFEIRHTWPPVLPGNTTLILIWVLWLIIMIPVAMPLSRSRKDSVRRILLVLIQFLWMGPVIFFLFEKVSLEIWSLISIPLAVLFSLAVINSRRKLTSGIFIFSMIIFMLLFQLERFF